MWAWVVRRIDSEASMKLRALGQRVTMQAVG